MSEARLALVAALAASAACGTTYAPPPSPRIALVVHGGGIHFRSCGRDTPVSAFGGTLEPLVASDDDAVRYARRARRELTLGVPGYLVGAAALATGLALHKPAGWYVAGGGVLAIGVGLGAIGAGVVNTIDAINIYDDRVTPSAP
jgi:hypothetical protein